LKKQTGNDKTVILLISDQIYNQEKASIKTKNKKMMKKKKWKFSKKNCF
jgi:hypothetical protein